MAEKSSQTPDEPKSESKASSLRPARAVQIPTPIPDDDSLVPKRPGDDDDVAVDFSRMPPVEGSGQLSHSQISGPLSGTSVVTWADLVNAQAKEEAESQNDNSENVDLRPPSAKAMSSTHKAGRL